MWSARHRSGPPRPATPLTVRTPNLLNRLAVVGDRDFLSVCGFDGCVAWVGGGGVLYGWVVWDRDVFFLHFCTSFGSACKSVDTCYKSGKSCGWAHCISCEPEGACWHMKPWRFNGAVNESPVTAFWRCCEWAANSCILKLLWTSCKSWHFEGVVNESPVATFWRCEWVTNHSILKVLWTAHWSQHFEGVVNESPVAAFWRCCECITNRGIFLQVSTLHSEMVRWMVQTLLRLAPDKEGNSQEAAEMALLGSVSVPQLHENAKQLFQSLHTFSNYVTLWVLDRNDAESGKYHVSRCKR